MMGSSMEKSISALQLGIIWQRLTGLMDEVAQTFVRTSFSVVVRENWDLACSLMDANGNEIKGNSVGLQLYFFKTSSASAFVIISCFGT